MINKIHELPLVSAIITTKNRPKGLEESVDSVLDQSYRNIELIIVDDASDLQAYKANKLLTQNIANYIYISKEDSKGGNHARNIGIQASKGKYIAFLDDDDIWISDKIEKQVELLEDDPTCKLVYCGFYAKYDNPIFNYAKLPNNNISGDLIEKRKFISPYFNTSVMMVERELITDVGMFDESVKYWQEYELMLRLIQKTNVKYVNEPLAVIDRSYKAGNRLTNKLDNWIESVRYIDNKHSKLFDLLNEKEKKEKIEYFYKEAAYRASLNNMRDRMKYYYEQAYITNPKIEYLIRSKLGLSRKNTLFLETLIMRVKYIIDCRKRKSD